MKTLYISDLNQTNLETVCQLLKAGGVVAFPTETVYGLGALLSQEKAIQRIFEIKKREPQKAMTLHLGSLDQVEQIAENIPKELYLLAKHFMPGPLTIILPCKKDLLKKYFSNLDFPVISNQKGIPTVGVRIPSHPLFLKLSKILKEPLVGTSANLSSEPALVSPQAVFDKFQGQIEVLIDGGESSLKKASTVLSLVDTPLILREGALKKADIEAVLQKRLDFL